MTVGVPTRAATPAAAPADVSVVVDDRPYQAEAVEAITAGLLGGGRGQLVAGCGSGKTLISLRAAERLVPSGGLVVFLTSSLALVAQALAGWRRDAVAPFAALAACSDDTVSDCAVRAADLPVPVSTSAQLIGEWIAGPGRRVVVATYQSADRVAAALTGTGMVADLVVYDEAHNVAGRIGPARRRLLDDTVLPARRRLFQTATPRTRVNDLSAGGLHTGRFLSMDEQSLYGPVLYRYPLTRGIAEHYLDDYQVAAIAVTDSDLHPLIADRSASYVLGATDLDLRSAAAQAALLTAVRTYGVRRIVSYHNRVAAARQFAATLPDTLALLGHPDLPLYAGHVSGAMTATARDRVLRNLADPPQGGFTLIANARCLREGVDIPAIDAILFADPRESETDIIQAVGRALRPSRPGVTSTSTIIVPTVLPDHHHPPDPADQEADPAADTAVDADAYRTLFRVVRAMRAHDDDLAAALDRARAAAAQPTRHQPDDPSADRPVGRAGPQLPDKIVLPVTADTAKRFLGGLSMTIVEQTTSAWWSGYAAARAYHAEHGHLRPDAGELREWLQRQRTSWRRGWLTGDQTRLLDELAMSWQPGEANWAATYQVLASWVAGSGTDVATTLIVGQTVVGHWLLRQRKEHEAGRLAPDRVRLLAELGVLDNPRHRRWAARLDQVRAYHAEHGHAVLPGDHPQYGWLNQQRAAYLAGRQPPHRQRLLADLGLVEPHPTQPATTQPGPTRPAATRVGSTDAGAGDWAAGLAALGRFVAKFGHPQVPDGFTTRDDLRLDSWLHRQRHAHHAGALPPDHAAALHTLGVTLTDTAGSER